MKYSDIEQRIKDSITDKEAVEIKEMVDREVREYNNITVIGCLFVGVLAGIELGIAICKMLSL